MHKTVCHARSLSLSKGRALPSTGSGNALIQHSSSLI